MFLKCDAKIDKKIESPNIRTAKRIKFLTATMPDAPAEGQKGRRTEGKRQKNKKAEKHKRRKNEAPKQ